MTVEKEMKTCKQCGVSKERVQDGRYKNLKDKRWRDPVSGCLWNGRMCPDCHRLVMASYRKNKISDAPAA